MPSCFATPRSCVVQLRICVVLPGVDSASSVKRVWIESMMTISGRSDSIWRTISSRRVSVKMLQLLLRMPIRVARILICSSDSSPDTYSVLRPLSVRAICNISVDLPMPGSPPRSISEPGIRPPPSTRFTSLMPVSMRCVVLVTISCTRRGSRLSSVLLRCIATALDVVTTCSLMVSHSLQAGQRPIHFVSSLPHEVQKNTLLLFAIVVS